MQERLLGPAALLHLLVLCDFEQKPKLKSLPLENGDNSTDFVETWGKVNERIILMPGKEQMFPILP